MRCEHCDAPMLEEQDPYGTGDLYYFLYEPTCDCEEQKERDYEESDV